MSEKQINRHGLALGLWFAIALAFHAALAVQSIDRLLLHSQGPHADAVAWILTFVFQLVTPLLCLSLGFYAAYQRPWDRRAWLLLLLLVSYAVFAIGTDAVDPVMSWPPVIRSLALVYRTFWFYSWPVWMILFVIYFPERSAADRSGALAEVDCAYSRQCALRHLHDHPDPEKRRHTAAAHSPDNRAGDAPVHAEHVLVHCRGLSRSLGRATSLACGGPANTLCQEPAKFRAGEVGIRLVFPGVTEHRYVNATVAVISYPVHWLIFSGHRRMRIGQDGEALRGTVLAVGQLLHRLKPVVR